MASREFTTMESTRNYEQILSIENILVEVVIFWCIKYILIHFQQQCCRLEAEKHNEKTNKTPNETEKNLEAERKKYFKLMIDKIKYGSFLLEGTILLKNDFSYGTNKVALKLKEIYKISDKLQKNIDFWNKKLVIEKNIKNGC